MYHFWIRVTQAPFTSARARWLSPSSRASATLFVQPGASSHGRCCVAAATSLRRVRRDASRRVCHTAARHADRWYSRCDARPLYFRPALESASNSIIHVPKRPPRPSNLGSPANSRAREYIRALMKLRKFRAKYRAGARADFSISSSGNRNNFRARTYALYKTANRSYERRVEMNNGRDVKTRGRNNI